jgi:hypothetical protein
MEPTITKDNFMNSPRPFSDELNQKNFLPKLVLISTGFVLGLAVSLILVSFLPSHISYISRILNKPVRTLSQSDLAKTNSTNSSSEKQPQPEPENPPEENLVDDESSKSSDFKIISKTYDLSETYDLVHKQDQVILYKKDKIIFEFELPEEILYAGLHPKSNNLALISKESPGLNTPHNLYIYSNNRLHSVYKGDIANKFGQEIIYDSLYFSGLEKDELTATYRSPVSFSPDGKIVAFTVRGFESASLNLYSLTTSHLLDPSFPVSNLSKDLYWSPNSQCLLADSGFMAFGPDLYIGQGFKNKSSFNLFETEGKDHPFRPRFKQTPRQVYWEETCSGYIQKTIDGKDQYYYFDYEQHLLEKVSTVPELESLTKTVQSDAEVETLKYVWQR